MGIGMVRCCAVGASLLAVGACGPVELGAAELDEVCGEGGPVQILALEPGAAAPVAWVRSPGTLADRLVLHVAYQEAGNAPPVAGASELWSVGTCGEDPRLLIENVELPGAAHGIWPDALAACDAESGEVQAVDPFGTHDPNPVLQAVDCWARTAPGGILTQEPNGNDTAALIYQPFPDDPWGGPAEPVELLPAVQTHYSWPHVDVFEDHVLALDWEGQVVQVSLPDGAVEVLATDARDFTANEGHVIWQGTENLGGDGDDVEGPVYLLDRTTGESTHLVDTSLAYTGFTALSLTDLGFVQLNLQADYSPVRIFALPALDHIDLDDVALLWPGDGENILAYHDGDLSLVDTESWSPERLLRGVYYRITTTGLQTTQILERGPAETSHGKLYRLTAEDGLDLIAPRATAGYRVLPDDRVVTAIRLNGAFFGELVVNGPDGLTQHIIDDEVAAYSIVPDPDDPTRLLYAVDDGDRTGVWLAKLPAVD